MRALEMQMQDVMVNVSHNLKQCTEIALVVVCVTTAVIRYMQRI